LVKTDFKAKWFWEKRKSLKRSFQLLALILHLIILHSFWDSSKKCAENQWHWQNKSQTAKN